MQTVANHWNGYAFRGTWDFDGHGISRDGERVFQMSSGEIPIHVNKQVAVFCQNAKKMYIDGTTDIIPEVFLSADLEEVKNLTIPVPVAHVEIKREDGRIARFALHVGYSERTGQVFATLSAQRRNTDTERKVTGSFVNWER